MGACALAAPLRMDKGEGEGGQKRKASSLLLQVTYAPVIQRLFARRPLLPPARPLLLPLREWRDASVSSCRQRRLPWWP